MIYRNTHIICKYKRGKNAVFFRKCLSVGEQTQQVAQMEVK